MQVEKEQVVDMLRAQGAHDRAQQVASALPKHVDTEADAALLQSLDVHVSEITANGGGTSKSTR
jgi:hypothetical protein